MVNGLNVPTPIEVYIFLGGRGRVWLRFWVCGDWGGM